MQIRTIFSNADVTVLAMAGSPSLDNRLEVDTQ
jgi:hypothetical protein